MGGFFGRLMNQWIEVIEWLDPTSDTMVYRFPVANNEIKMGAKLTVREGQAAIFVNEGQIADVFGPGLYSLTTQNMPLLTMLKSWPHGFNSPFKAEVYFVSTRQFTDLKWGTANPIPMRDQDFGVVRVRAFGSYSMRVTDPAKFMREVVGTDG
ncbi:MAG: putative virion core protein (lumpy skin disease virus), partial [Armatimonadetes bacterium]|nr:putative virion core protein (lumpy skin disease virus) [Armatimonadota bacterium]